MQHGGSKNKINYNYTMISIMRYTMSLIMRTNVTTIVLYTMTLNDSHTITAIVSYTYDTYCKLHSNITLCDYLVDFLFYMMFLLIVFIYLHCC